jgi:hypothetical protein
MVLRSPIDALPPSPMPTQSIAPSCNNSASPHCIPLISPSPSDYLNPLCHETFNIPSTSGSLPHQSPSIDWCQLNYDPTHDIPNHMISVTYNCSSQSIPTNTAWHHHPPPSFAEMYAAQQFPDESSATLIKDLHGFLDIAAPKDNWNKVCGRKIDMLHFL